GIWRIAPFIQQQQELCLEVARRTEVYGVLRQQKSDATYVIWNLRVAQDRLVWRGAQMGKFKTMCVTATCASRRTDGAAREHGNLRKSRHFNMEQGSIRGSRF
ncbi:hypothetical protein A2U01_0021653, partial [Trifolium medium]|nr:hypothetical protein [Trifolium medium]